MKQKFLAGGVLMVLLVIGAIVRSFFFTSTDKQTFVHGDLTIRAGETRTVKNDAPLLVTGDLTVRGTLTCDRAAQTEGALSLSVGGTLRVEGTIECLPEHPLPSGHAVITIVAMRMIFDKTANVSSNGSVDLVTSEGALVKNTSLIESWRTLASKDKGSSFGPFVESDPKRDIREGSGTTNRGSETDIDLSGVWKVGDEMTQNIAPTMATRQLIASPYLHVDGGDTGVIRLHNFVFESGSGRQGQDETGEDCDALGGAGGDAPFVRLHAGNILADDLTIRFGNGGRGGDAETRGDCALGQAIAGKGGRAGNLLFTATQTLEIGKLNITSGKGGRGGDARAHGKIGIDACGGETGGDARAVGGDGGGSVYMLQANGDVRGVDHVMLTRVVGGDGGFGVATAGSGGKGSSCGCSGGNGGKAEARGGNGGVASALLIARTTESHGGDAGRAEAVAGAGGDGGGCTTLEQGGMGGEGGSALSVAGAGGKGATAKGIDGVIKSMIGGDGGEGGAGCPPGAGGIGGVGAPLGQTKTQGVSLCPSTAPAPEPTGMVLIKAILYHENYLPKDQLTVSRSTGCGEAHWRPMRKTVTATNGKIIDDPLAACGFGKLSETPVIETPSKVLDVDQPALY